MNANLELLDHAVDLFPPPERALDGLVRRRERQDRNRRIGSAVLALAVAGAAIGGAFAVFRSAERERPADTGSSWVRRFGTSGRDQAIGVAVEGSRILAVELAEREGRLYLDEFDLAGNEVATHALTEVATQDATFAADADALYVAVRLGTQSVALKKFDLQGRELWSRDLEPGSEVSAIDVEGGALYAGGSLKGKAAIWRYDLDGTLLWARRFGGPRRAAVEGLVADASGVDVAGVSGYVPPTCFTGRGLPPCPPGTNGSSGRNFVARFDAGGDRTWQEDACLIPDWCSNFSRGVDMTPGPAGFFVAASGTRAMAIRSYDSNGDVRWTRKDFPQASDEDAGDESLRTLAAGDGRVYAIGTTVVAYGFGGQRLWTRSLSASSLDGVTYWYPSISSFGAGSVLVAGTLAAPREKGTSSQDNVDLFLERLPVAARTPSSAGTSGAWAASSLLLLLLLTVAIWFRRSGRAERATSSTEPQRRS